MSGYKQHLLIQGGVSMANQTVITAAITVVTHSPSMGLYHSETPEKILMDVVKAHEARMQ